MNLISEFKMSRANARAILEEIRWPDGPVCPHCAHGKRIHSITGKSARDGLYECGECKKQFTVTVGTVMHNSRIPLLKWIATFYMICSQKRGVSAAQLQRDLNLGSYRTAWHMAHRIRAAMQEDTGMGKSNSGRLSMHGIDPKDALRAFMQVDPEAVKCRERQMRQDRSEDDIDAEDAHFAMDEPRTKSLSEIRKNL